MIKGVDQQLNNNNKIQFMAIVGWYLKKEKKIIGNSVHQIKFLYEKFVSFDLSIKSAEKIMQVAISPLNLK